MVGHEFELQLIEEWAINPRWLEHLLWIYCEKDLQDMLKLEDLDYPFLMSYLDNLRDVIRLMSGGHLDDC